MSESTSSIMPAETPIHSRITRKKTNLEKVEEKKEGIDGNLQQEQENPRKIIDGRKKAYRKNGDDGRMNENEEDDEQEEEEESDESEPEIPEMMVPNRSRRANAGRKMHELLSQQLDGQEVDKDDFYYKDAYGGFQELDQDDDFESPPHTSDEEEIEVDSDFDNPEEQDEKDDAEMANRFVDEAERAERRQKKLKKKQILERNKNWAIARINKLSVPENSCDARTQRQRLEEAKKTAEFNIASLKRFEEFEVERRKRQSKAVPKRILEGARIRDIMTADGKHLLVLPEISPKEQLFPKPNRREYRVCAVTGRPARYFDPLTKLPYADMAAFRTIRDKYKEFLMTEQQREPAMAMNGNSRGNKTTMEGDAKVATGFARQQTPAKQRKLAPIES